MNNFRLACEKLRNAIRENGNDAIQWVLNATDRELWNTWEDEIWELATSGDCELSGRYTWHGNPVIVRL